MESSINSYLYSSVIAVCYVIFSILEMRFINVEAKPLKDVFKNTVIVFFSSVCSFYILANMSINSATSIVKPTEIFTGNPEF